MSKRKSDEMIQFQSEHGTNIYITDNNKYLVLCERNKKKMNKRFDSLEEAKNARDEFIKSYEKSITIAPKPLIDENSALLPCRDNDGNVITWAIISVQDEEILSKFKFHMITDGYPGFKINGKSQRLHLHVYYELMKGERKQKYVVDHINGNRCDSRRENLRIASYELNAHNKNKKDGTTSVYRCVSQGKGGSWYVYDISGKLRTFSSESSAGYFADLVAKERFGKDAILNNVEKPDNYEETIVSSLKKDIEKESCIKITKYNTFEVNVDRNGNTFQKTFKTMNEAKIARDKFIDEEEKKAEETLNLQPVSRTSEGIAYRITSGKYKVQVLMDDDIYEKYKSKSIHAQKSKNRDNYYVAINIEGVPICLHILVMNRFGQGFDKLKVDHINRNTLDNRRSNLRVVSISENAQNSVHSSNSTGFHGVCKQRSKFCTNITKDGQLYYCGLYDTRELAALAYNYIAEELYGPTAFLNDVINNSEYFWNSSKRRLILGVDTGSCRVDGD